MKKLTLEDALEMVPTHFAFKLTDVSGFNMLDIGFAQVMPEETRIATAKTIQFLSTVDKPGSIGSPDLKFAAWLLERSGWKNGSAN